VKSVAVVRVVAIETPPVFLVMLQHDVVMRIDELATRAVRGQVLFVVTLGAGKVPFRERRWRDFHAKKS
jgi:hypothetical protein